MDFQMKLFFTFYLGNQTLFNFCVLHSLGTPTFNRSDIRIGYSQGKLGAVYDFKYNKDWIAGPLKLLEHHIYRSSRLGIVQRNQDMMQPKAAAVNEDLLGPTFVYSCER